MVTVNSRISLTRASVNRKLNLQPGINFPEDGLGIISWLQLNYLFGQRASVNRNHDLQFGIYLPEDGHGLNA